jgi:hypothetical protein
MMSLQKLKPTDGEKHDANQKQTSHGDGAGDLVRLCQPSEGSHRLAQSALTLVPSPSDYEARQ